MDACYSLALPALSHASASCPDQMGSKSLASLLTVIPRARYNPPAISTASSPWSHLHLPSLSARLLDPSADPNSGR